MGWRKAGCRSSCPAKPNGNGLPAAWMAGSYPWGDDFDPEKANMGETGIGTTSAVGCFSAGSSREGSRI